MPFQVPGDLHITGLPRQPTSQHIMLAQLECIDRVCHYVYRKFIDCSAEQLRSCGKWKDEFKGTALNWSIVSCKKVKEAEIRSFQYKFVHRITNLSFKNLKCTLIAWNFKSTTAH